MALALSHESSNNSLHTDELQGVVVHDDDDVETEIDSGAKRRSNKPNGIGYHPREAALGDGVRMCVGVIASGDSQLCECSLFAAVFLCIALIWLLVWLHGAELDLSIAVLLQ